MVDKLVKHSTEQLGN